MKMPFARVGAMPQPSPNKKKQNNGDGVFSRRQGITMEDLKKQTAIRLAHEQRQPVRPTGGTVGQNRDNPRRPLSEHQVQGYSRPPEYVQGPQGAAFPSHSPFHAPYQGQQVANNIQQNAPTYQSQQQHYQQQPPPPMDYNPGTNVLNYNRNYSEIQQPYARNQPTIHSQTSVPQSQFSQSGTSATGKKNWKEKCRRSKSQITTGPNTNPGGPYNQTISCEAPNVQNSTMPSSKLPHGLTVHELKAMTKARLQAEASHDRNETEGRRDLSMDNSRPSPSDFDSVHEPRERALSRDSPSRNHHVGLNHGMGSDSVQSIPSLVHVNQGGGRELNTGRQPQVSPLPAGFLNMSSVGQSLPPVGGMGGQQQNGPARDLWPNQLRPEAWETASSASQSSAVLSENLGSDSAHSSSFQAGMNFPVDSLPPPRSRSYTCPAAPIPRQRDFKEENNTFRTSPGRVGHYFEPAVGRRRSCTISPKQGSIHEDHPHFIGDDLALPSFSNTDQSTFLSPSRKKAYPSMLSPLGGEQLISGGANAGYVADGLNRRRAFSATSVPQFSEPATDFADQNSSFEQLTYGQYATSPFEPTRERAKSEDVYQGRQYASTTNVRTPPGFSARNEIGAGANFDSYQSFSHVDGYNSSGNEAAPLTSVGNTLSSLGINAHEMQQPLLNLSDVGLGDDRPDRERSNTYPIAAPATSTEAFFTEHFLNKGPFRN